MIRYALLLIAIAALGSCGGGSSGCNVNCTSSSPTSSWTWVGGSNQTGALGVYGTKGSSSATNIPGSRYISISWTDSSGNLWMFGGWNGTTTFLNDLWKYSPGTNLWTWVSGSSAANASGIYGIQGISSARNVPGARMGAVSWHDSSGNLWLYGGYGFDELNLLPGTLNDLWKFSITTNEWTWVSGSKSTGASPAYGAKDVASTSNTPGGLLGAIGWTSKDGHLWFFGGASDLATTTTYNNLWEFNPGDSTWTFRSGAGKTGSSYSTNVSGTYEVQGIATSTTVPGSRLDAISWLDSSGNLWLFGGSGFDGLGNPQGILNDLWKYSPTTKQWVWMSGDRRYKAYGVYGSQGEASPNNVPGARFHRTPFSWIDAGGSLWMFGGDGNGASTPPPPVLPGTASYLNDLWKYTPTNNQWTWMGGSSEINGIGVYGSMGMLASTNQPGGRKDSIGWTDLSGNLWIFGGFGYDATNSAGYLNDLWKYIP